MKMWFLFFLFFFLKNRIESDKERDGESIVNQQSLIGLFEAAPPFLVRPVTFSSFYFALETNLAQGYICNIPPPFILLLLFKDQFLCVENNTRLINNRLAWFSYLFDRTVTQQRSLAAIVYYTGDNLMCTLFDQKVWRIRHENDSDENHNGENGTDGRNPAPFLFEINQDTCKNQAPSSKTQIENGKFEFFFFYHLLFDQNFYWFWSSNKWKLERKKIKINFGVTSHPRRLVAKIPADIMAEKSIPRAPRIEMVVVSPEIVETTNKYFITSSQKNPWRNGQSCFVMRLIKILSTAYYFKNWCTYQCNSVRRRSRCLRLIRRQSGRHRAYLYAHTYGNNMYIEMSWIDFFLQQLTRTLPKKKSLGNNMETRKSKKRCLKVSKPIMALGRGEDGNDYVTHLDPLPRWWEGSRRCRAKRRRPGWPFDRIGPWGNHRKGIRRRPRR